MPIKIEERLVALENRRGDSQRKHDLNGWFEVDKNPISKVGIFDYLGSSIKRSIDDGIDPNKAYRILRPEEELSDEACVSSFRLLPFIDDHEFLGGGEGLTPTEEYGSHGTTGENVRFEYPYLFSNIKVFSEKLKGVLADGKKELSCGYRCDYDMTPGTWNGQQYDGVQRNIRGNHLALVTEGRMGPDVAVLDHYKMTIDAKEFVTMDIKQVSDTLEKVVKRLDAMDAKDKARDEAAAEETKKAEEKAAADKAKDEEEKAAAEKEAADKAKDEEGMSEEEKKAAEAKGADKGKGADAKAVASLSKQVADQAKQIADQQKTIDAMKTDAVKAVMSEMGQREELATKLIPFIGMFDHKDKTLQEVAAYGADKLGLKPEKGQEVTAVSAYLHGRSAPSVALDHASTGKSSGILDQFNQA